jgi:sugar/nucleoside kinase (ribokinase family)
VKPEVVVAGHLCLDVIPPFVGTEVRLEPGRLVEVGPALFSTGGAVSNVGLSLHRLGVPVGLMAMVGDDVFGSLVRRRLHDALGEEAIVGVRVSLQGATSYTLVINPPGTDRMFLHHAGLNDLFSATDIDLEAVSAAKLLHVGYPPLMAGLYDNGGAAFSAALSQAKAAGVTVSLDMAMPDPGAPSGKVDWPAFLKRVLPNADLFMPSFSEILFMLKRDLFDMGQEANPGLLAELSETLLDWGAAVVALTLGERGLYLRTAGRERLLKMGRAGPDELELWANRELWAPVFDVTAKGTTGAGDAAVAGFIAGLLHRLGPEEALKMASAVGACSVEGADAVSGVQSWQETKARLRGGWRTRDDSPGESWERGAGGVWRGPGDGGP